MQQAAVTDRGFEHDRRWMLVDENNRFLSQRTMPKMALFKVSILPAGLQVIYRPTNAVLLVPFKPLSQTLFEVSVWDDICLAQPVSDKAGKWFSDILGINCQLVYMPDDIQRIVNPRYAHEKTLTSFSDAYPFMLIGQASLDDLNKRVGASFPMNRFRPNIVFTGGEAYAEDKLAHFTINHIHFHGVKLCIRCPIPGIDQDTGISGKEPLKTLANYRRKANNVYFGQNLVHTGQGVIRLGDELNILGVKNAMVFD